jgi:hypothetical protein
LKLLYLWFELSAYCTEKPSSCAYWQGWNHLHHLLAGKFHLVMTAVSQALQQTPEPVLW